MKTQIDESTRDEIALLMQKAKSHFTEIDLIHEMIADLLEFNDREFQELFGPFAAATEATNDEGTVEALLERLRIEVVNAQAE